MTLVAAFRCQNGGILLCADREENDGVTKRQIDKIYQIRQMPNCDVLLAASGPSAFVSRSCSEINDALTSAFNAGADLRLEHKALIESRLKFMHESYPENLYGGTMDMLIVYSERGPGYSPLLYRSQQSMLELVSFYASCGIGKVLCDYLADRLYDWERIENVQLITLAAFIFREVHNSVDGVGADVDVRWIREGNGLLTTVGPEYIKAIQEQFPPLLDTVISHWKDRVHIPTAILP
jgi:hypothetical protein